MNVARMNSQQQIGISSTNGMLCTHPDHERLGKFSGVRCNEALPWILLTIYHTTRNPDLARILVECRCNEELVWTIRHFAH